MTKNLYGERISIEVVAGGFILTYPVFVSKLEKFGIEADGVNETVEEAREVFVSPRKLNQKLKDVIASVSLVADDKE
jgi:hypothetical protein